MLKKILGLVVIGGLGYVSYDYYRAGFHTAPEHQTGDFLLSYSNGLRAVMRGIDNEKASRTYLGYPANNIPSWYQDTWSICRIPTDDEATAFLTHVEIGPGGRLDAICEIDADGDVFVRGWVASVPDL
ncbi:hypothetical protein [Litoreibacter roseus]|uniref:Uncharacterized protein n=1 Tax=Litoreibacter roseus TaxID=2601869 RepID=A0A6N6JF09_9RHOB|nr:hypothetical protein [Litoreibacter roseus]GFE64931.1 hypothetical protein KIN_20050 [Litoreibacter roseus]